MTGTLQLPTGRYTLTRATVPAAMAKLDESWPEIPSDGLVAADITVEGGRITAFEPSEGQVHEGPVVDLVRRMVWPCPIDMHTHLDKGHIWPRAANPDGTFMGALDTVGKDRVANWTAADVRARMEFSLRCAYAHGTRAIRTHLDSIQPQDAISWPVFSQVREAWRGRIELQAVSLAMQEHYRGSLGEDLARRVAEHGGVLGLVPQMTPDLDADLDHFFALAAKHRLDIDCHIDETLDPSAMTLRHLARAAIRHGFGGRIVAGHCCSLSTQAPDEVKTTLDDVAMAGIAIVSLPMCNMYLQDRHAGRTPRRRGVTLAHEIRARGIPMVFASDNTRDPFYAFGDLDLVEVFREAVRIAHLDHPVGTWPAAISTLPSAIMCLDLGSIAEDGPADLIVLEGRTWSEALSRPQADRTVLRAGKAIHSRPPSYAELDELLGVSA